MNLDHPLARRPEGVFVNPFKRGEIIPARQPMSASLIGGLGSSAFRLSAIAVSMSLAGSCFSSESAPGPFHHGIRGRGGTIFGAALPLDKGQVQADMRTHLIHRPARDVFPRLCGSRVFSYRIDLTCPSCRCGFPGPAELGAVNPDAVHDHGQPTCQGDDRLFHPAAPGNLHRPGLEPRPLLRPQHALRCFVEQIAARAMEKWTRPSSDDLEDSSIAYLHLEKERS
jgi:hypothetical protein